MSKKLIDFVIPDKGDLPFSKPSKIPEVLAFQIQSSVVTGIPAGTREVTFDIGDLVFNETLTIVGISVDGILMTVTNQLRSTLGARLVINGNGFPINRNVPKLTSNLVSASIPVSYTIVFPEQGGDNFRPMNFLVPGDSQQIEFNTIGILPFAAALDDRAQVNITIYYTLPYFNN